ncbi:MAG: gliding motility-associated C-terminal domain-containing protein, partial [Flavobacteriales bacterium]
EVSDLNTTSYVDEDVFFGGNYCYMIVSCFANESVSIASEEFCAVLAKTGPVITNASVESTSETGEVSVAWSPPTELDLENFPGPYHYKLFSNDDYSGAQELILETIAQATLDNPDTLFTHNPINTIENPNSYRVELYSGEDLVQSSATASTIFLELIPDDNEITIVMNLAVPWQNLSYEVFRFNNDLSIFESIGTTMDPVFVDEDLVNNVEYCYYVTSTGTYGDPSINDPLVNSSQEVCGQAIDFTAPCAPSLSIDDDCDLEMNTLTWSNPNLTCADDVVEYNIYYAPTAEDELALLTTINLSTDTTFVFNELDEFGTIAGCFAVSASDSLLVYDNGFVNQNESEFSNVICIDNCPVYDLPNVFTPNNDGSNDLFVPFPYRFVESIDLKVFNRWGTCVFESQDPTILWDGKDKDSGETVTDGTYFYSITVNTIRLSGIVPLEQSGFIQVLGGQNQTNN